MYLREFIALAGALSVSLATAVPSPRHAVHEKRLGSTAWVKRDKPLPDTLLPVRIGLAQPNLDRGHDHLMDISDPTSPLYGKHWTAQQVAEFFSPPPATADATTEWLLSSGFSMDRLRLTGSRNYIMLSATVEELERLLQTDYFVFEHTGHGGNAIACDEYRIPSHLREHIDFITPGVSFSGSSHTANALRKRQATTSSCTPVPTGTSNSTLDNCWLNAHPKCISEMYQIPSEIKNHTGNQFAIFSSGPTYLQKDMDIFFKNVATEIPLGTIPRNQYLNGAKLSTKYQSALNEEADLDFQIAWPLVYPYNLTLVAAQLTVAQGKADTNPLRIGKTVLDSLNDMLEAFDKSYCTNTTNPTCGSLSVPQVLSVSYEGNETDVSQAAATRLCNEVMKLSLQGTTVFTSSGDAGVAANDHACVGPQDKTFAPDMFGSCPYVTTVGATAIQRHGSIQDREVVAFQPQFNFTSSGGFSNYHKIPRWQADAVEQYFCENPTPYPIYNYNGSASSIGARGGRFNRNGRAMPDVSALGANITAAYKGCLTNEGGGTSAASPLWASIIWRINAERLAAGKSTLGFINPTLYANPGAMNDVVSGHNLGCETQGFSAAKGWDPVTGLGTPNYPRLLSVFMSLP